MAATSSEYVNPTSAMITPPAAKASTAPMVPADSSQPPVSTTQPKPIIAPNPMARVSQLPSALIREVESAGFPWWSTSVASGMVPPSAQYVPAAYGVMSATGEGCWDGGESSSRMHYS